jgi:hypothetical protein
MGGPIRTGRIVLLCLIAVMAVAPQFGRAAPRKGPPAPPPPLVSDADRAALAGPWKGTWTGNKFGYTAVMTLVVAADGTVAGTINWTLSTVPNSKAEHLVGMTGIENIRGNYNPTAAVLSVAGYSKADPNDIVELDQYLLVVAPNRETMGGLTGEHGAWTGQFFLSR